MVPIADRSPEAKPEDFSLVMGGPLYQFFLRLGLVYPPMDRVGWRMLLISMVAWAPLLVLTMLDGRFLSQVKIPFFRDFEVHVRLLVSLPLLIAAEVTIHHRMKGIVSQFLERRIVPAATRARFEDLKASAQRLRNSTTIELILLALVFLVGGLVWRELNGLQLDTWYVSILGNEPVRTPAGTWYKFVSIPTYQFILLRWYFRLFIWMRFLRQVSKLDLHLVPTHPDRACGLGFLDGTVFAMGPLLLAHTCLLAGVLANRLLYDGAKLPEHYAEILMMAAFLLLITVGPLCVFTIPLAQARRRGLRIYGRLASDYVIGFDRKWIGGERPPDEPLVGTADIQSLADLGNSFQIVKEIVPFPFGRSSLIGMVVVIALPLLPLGLTMFSARELAVRILQIVL